MGTFSGRRSLVLSHQAFVLVAVLVERPMALTMPVEQMRLWTVC